MLKLNPHSTYHQRGKTPIQRFNGKFIRNELTGCWEWTDSLCRRGYGEFYLNGKKEAAHRVSWIFNNGPIPDGKCVLHSCDNPCCVRPSHLFIGSQRDNIRDMVKKGRLKTPNFKGELHGGAKLTELQVREILASHWLYTRKDLAKIFGVTQENISSIINGKSWKHLQGAMR
jgi:hypothetical protein